MLLCPSALSAPLPSHPNSIGRSGFLLQRENSERERDTHQAQLRYDAENVHLIELEEQQFQNYAKEVSGCCAFFYRKSLVFFFPPPPFSFFFSLFLLSLLHSPFPPPPPSLLNAYPQCSQVIDHCEKGGRNTYPLKKAARAGAGGGLGPQFPGKAGVRPSYQTADNQGVQLPNYKRDSTDKVKETINGDGNTHNRMGFVW